ncbi:hypothetical protein SLA2020_425360 [Shorea laevis]
MARNKLIHEAIHPEPNKAIKHISSLREIHVTAWKAVALPSLWSPPRHGSLKGNFDVAVRGDFAIVAVVISDYQGILSTLPLLSSLAQMSYLGKLLHPCLLPG